MRIALRRSLPLGKFASLLMPLAFTACSAESSSETAFIRRDSAGIRIVESASPAWAAGMGWEVADSPKVRIGVIEGAPEYLFSNIEGALLLAGGRLAVADRGSSQVRFYGADGTYERFAGGPGGGPGELGYIRGLGRCGADSVYVFELNYNNVVFTSDGQYVREGRPWDVAAEAERPYELACNDRGFYAAVGWAIRDPQAPSIGFHRAEAPAWILAPVGAAPNEPLARVPGAGLVMTARLGPVLSSERLGTARGSGPHPFGRAARISVTDDGIYLGTGENFEVRRYAFDGSLAAIIRWAGHDVTIRDEDIAAYRETLLASAEEARRPAIERQLMEMENPPQFPTYVAMLVDAGGNLWLQRFRRPADVVQEWTVLSPDGALLGSVRMPDGLSVTDIGEDVVLGVHRDGLGVERVQVHSLLKRQ